MLSVLRNVKWIKCRDLYFCNHPPEGTIGEDVQYFLQSTKQLRGSQPFLTSLIDLTIDVDSIFNRIKKNVAYEIRRAKNKDLVAIRILDAEKDEDRAVFIKFYDRFAASKGLAPSNKEKLKQLAKENGLLMSVSIVEQNRNNWLSAHAYICDGNRARLLYSGSDISMHDTKDRQLIGRANKNMHWHMIQFFKENNYKEYDFGGLGSQEEVKNIAEFKLSFGGREVLEYNFLKGISIKGMIAISVFKLLTKFKKIRANIL